MELSATGARFYCRNWTVHRGMFHSIPALIIASEVTFLAYHSSDMKVRILMAIGTGLGFLSHLVLDEMYKRSMRDGAKRTCQVCRQRFRDEILRDRRTSQRDSDGVIAVPELTRLWLKQKCYATPAKLRFLKLPPQITAELPDAPPFRIADQLWGDTQLQ
ncbi:MAG: metal-dependent hydrolase [Planctomycetaceae bacterium]